MPFRAAIVRIGIAAVVTTAGGAQSGEAQSREAQAPTPRIRRFSLAAGISTIQVGNRNDWGYGPELGFRRDFGSWGVRLNIAAPAFGSNAGGAAIDLGPSLVRVRRDYELGASAGLTALLIGDNAELVDGGAGVFGEGHAALLLGPAFGFTLGSTLRLGRNGVYPGVSAGVVLRL